VVIEAFYAPHLNPTDHLWGVMHNWITHNRHYAKFNQFTEAIWGSFAKLCPTSGASSQTPLPTNFDHLTEKIQSRLIQQKLSQSRSPSIESKNLLFKTKSDRLQQFNWLGYSKEKLK
jgi:hypothetical protein